MALDLSRHPCFDAEARHQYARVHLPVAPKCNIQCNFCDRRSDCLGESRPGVSSAVLTPLQALAYTRDLAERERRLSVVGIAGPGEPFANAPETLETLRLVRQQFGQMLLCVASNGLSIEPHVPELAELEVSHVTLTINAVDPAVAAVVYRWVRSAKRAFRGLEAAELLVERQLGALAALVRHGITAKVNTIVIPGVNDRHALQVAEKVGELGASVHNLMPLYPVAGTPFGNLSPPSSDQMDALRAQAGKFLPQMSHCARCRADAAGLIGQANGDDQTQLLQLHARRRDSVRRVDGASSGSSEAPAHVAVATLEGVLVNQHVGEADGFYIYGKRNGRWEIIDRRPAPAAGGGRKRWLELGALLPDCWALIACGAGGAPKRVLQGCGIQVLLTESLVQDALAALDDGRPLPALITRTTCGEACQGNGLGCG